MTRGMDHAQNFNECLWGKPALNSIWNGRGCHIIEVILWTFLAQSAVLTARELQQNGGRKAAWKTCKRFTFLMRLLAIGKNMAYWHSCPSTIINFRVTQSQPGTTLLQKLFSRLGQGSIKKVMRLITLPTIIFFLNNFIDKFILINLLE